MDDSHKVHSLLAFTGFNPVITFNIIMDLIKADKSRIKCLQTAIVFGLSRGFGAGKTWDTIYQRTSEAGQAKLKAAVAAFEIKLGKPRGPQTITIPRIIAAFPMHTFRIHNLLLEKGLVDTTDAIKAELPDQFAYIGSPSIMSGEVFKALLPAYVNYCKLVSAKWKSEQSEEDITKFAELSFRTRLTKDSERVVMPAETSTSD
jgi:hypothetical protein